MLRGGGDKGTTCKTLDRTTPDPTNQQANRERHKPSKNVELKMADGNLPQSDYEGVGEFYVGRRVLKDFKGVSYRGVVSNCDVEWSGGEIWEITYEDMNTEDLYHKELMEVLLPDGGNREWGGGFSPNPSAPPRTYTSSAGDTFPQICRERFGLMNVVEMKRYLKFLPPELQKYIKNPFGKKPKGMPRHAGDDRVGEGHQFPDPEDLEEYISERNKTWKKNYKEVPTKMINDSLMAASVVASKVEASTETSGAFAVEKSTGKVIAPERVQDAIDRDDLELWLTAWNDELEGLSMDGQHISHNHTREEVRKMGIHEPALPTRMISAAKYRGLEFDRRKGRLICQGFRAIEGIHHDGKAFAASPSQYSQKLLMSFVAGKGYYVRSWDIKTAYLFGERVKPVCLSYPVGFRREKDGEELFMVARRGHYGEINAGRMWAETRTKQILKMYDSPNWSVHICKSDPCLNIITHWPNGKPAGFKWRTFGDENLDPEGGNLPSVHHKTVEEVKKMGGITSYMSVYTDDIDVVGPDEKVLEMVRDVMHKVWNCKYVPSDFMLGMKREIFEEKGVRKVRMSQAAFFMNAFDEFDTYTKPYLSTRKFPSTPLPHNTVINKSMAGDENEAKAVLEVGYQKLAGCILWGARGCAPETLWAASQVCSLMSAPSWKAWNLAIGVLAYQYSVKDRGIVFRGDGNDEPILLADASFKIDPHTGKTQYGTLALLYGGPVIAVSKRIPYVALSTPHAELCAMNYAARTAAWLENILIELGEPLKKKTLLLGDNTVAVLNATEDVVSEKNKYIQLAFHYIKERRNHLDVHHVGTKLMLADVLTKSVSRDVLEYLVGWFTGTGRAPYAFVRPKVFK